MKLTARSTSRMYALTCLACVAVTGWNAKETEAATAGAKDDEGSTDR